MISDDDVFYSPDGRKENGRPPWHPIKRRRKDSTASLASLQSIDLPSRKRKRKSAIEDGDNISIQSLDITKDSKRKRSLKSMASLANILSPVNAMRKLSSTLQRSTSFRMPSSGSGICKTPQKQIEGCKNSENAVVNGFKVPAPSPCKTPKYKKPPPAKIERRESKLWRDSVDGNIKELLNEKEMSRQEVIHELLQGEEDLIQDLQNVKKVYHDGMKTLHLMTEDELKQIFGIIEELVPIHKDLVSKLSSQKNTEGSIDSIGKILVDWLPCLRCYIEYCANQVFAKALLDEKKHQKKVDDFLQRCYESPFSRRLDLWSFLDVPRSRLVKYPLLLKKIQKYTKNEHEDKKLLDDAVEVVEKIISEVNEKTGISKCRFVVSQLEFLEESTEVEYLLGQSRALLCEGSLKNTRGTKVNAFLFDRALVLTRPATREGSKKNQVYRQPIPASELVLEDLKDGEIKMGSFRTAFAQGQTCKHVFKVSFKNPSKGQAHTLQANDEHDKKQWLSSIEAVINGSALREKEEQDVQFRTNGDISLPVFI